MHKPLIAISPTNSALACVSIGICVTVGFLTSDIQLTQTLNEAKVYGLLAVALAILAALAPAVRANPASVLLFAIAVLSVQFVGVSAAIGVVAFGLACATIGRRVMRLFGQDDLLVSLFVGIFLLSGFLGWLLPYKIHNRFFYTAGLTALLWFERHAVKAILTATVCKWSEALSVTQGASSFALIVVALSTTTAWLPSILFDDLAYHLMLPAQLQHLGYYRLDVATQVWAIAPWGSDIVHAAIGVLADSDARGAVNIGWFTLAGCALWRVCELIGLDNRWRWLGIALFASQPYISGLLGTAQVENELTPLTFVLTALCIKVCRDKDYDAVYPIVILAGLFASLKSSQALVILPLLLICATARPKVSWRRLLIASSIALVFCSSSYFYSWFLTGNPLLPLLNTVFKSPFFPINNFHDSRWSQGINWRTLWDLTFQTGKYQETYPGGAGISILALSPFLLLALRQPEFRRTLIWLLLALMGMFGAIQYLRYIAPLLAATIPLALFSVNRHLTRRVAITGVTSLIVINTLLIPSSIWVLKNGLLRDQLASLANKSKGEANQRILNNFAFEKVSANFLLADETLRGSVLLADKNRPFTAPFAGRAFADSWYDFEFQTSSAEADADPSGRAWAQLLNRTGIRYVLASHGASERPALAKAMEARATPILTGPAQTLYCLCSGDVGLKNVDALYNARDLSSSVRLR